MTSRTMNKIKNIAFIASENKKSELIEWSYFNRDLLMKHEIIAVGASAIKILEGTLNKQVNRLISGPLGGYRMLAEMIDDGKIDMLILFTANETEQKDFDIFLQSVKNNNVIIAFNKSTADFIFNSSLLSKEYFVKKPVIPEQKNSLEFKKDKLRSVPEVKAA